MIHHHLNSLFHEPVDLLVVLLANETMLRKRLAQIMGEVARMTNTASSK